MPRFIATDATDVLKRKCARFELNEDKDLLMIDLPKRFAGDGATRFTDTIVERRLDKEEVLRLISWLTTTVEQMDE